jgi:enoyl-[acyl-carrier protein] reductase I
MLNLEGRTAVVFGLANKRSIAWAIAQKLHAAGVYLAISYQNERLRADAEELAAALPGAQLFQCDVSADADIERVFGELKERYGKLHVLVHSVAYAPADALQNPFSETSRESFR